MKIAILHEMLIKLGGAEKVVESLCKIFPNADLYTLIYDEKKVKHIFPSSKIKKVASITQNIYSITKKQRLCLPFMAYAVESLDFSDYDLVIVSSSGFAHGLITKPETRTVVYYHSPARYLWDWTNEYKRDIGFDVGLKGFFFNRLIKKLREWDYIASSRGDILLANSKNVQKRIEKYYRRSSEVVYPPIEVDRFQNNSKIKNIAPDGEYFIIVSALTEFKKIEIAIENFLHHPERKLIIVGEGNYRDILEKKTKGKDNIIFCGAKYGEQLVSLVAGSIGLIFPGEEDFGIVPIEALAAGKPVFAYYGGGLKETIEKGISGHFFYDRGGKDFGEEFEKYFSLIKAQSFHSETLKEKARSYSFEVFKKQILKIVK